MSLIHELSIYTNVVFGTEKGFQCIEVLVSFCSTVHMYNHPSLNLNIHCVYRMVSCGRENVRLWRVKGGTLRSCPITLDSRYHHMHFTDVAFQPGYPNGSDIYNRNV